MSYQEYLQSDHWKEKRKEALEFYGYSCQYCGLEVCLEVHHHHYRTMWNEVCKDDLIVLCDDCHECLHWYLKLFIDVEPKKEFSLHEFLFMAMTEPWRQR